jgi:hypothetical protein
MTVDQFAQEVTMGKLAADIMAEAKKITILRHIGIKKTTLISTPESRAIEEAKPVEATATPSELSLRIPFAVKEKERGCMKHHVSYSRERMCILLRCL